MQARRTLLFAIFITLIGFSSQARSQSGSVPQSTPSDDLRAYVDFSKLPIGAIPDGFEAAHFPIGGDAKFAATQSEEAVALTEVGDRNPEDILYSRRGVSDSLSESFSFRYTGPDSVVEPILVVAQTASQRAGFVTNLSVSAPGNNSAGEEFFEYVDLASGKIERSIRGKLRTTPFFYKLGHIYRVDLIADPVSHVLSTRVYDQQLGPQAFDQTIKVVAGPLKTVYPGIMNARGGVVTVFDLSFGPAGSLPISLHEARRAEDFRQSLGYNASVGAAADSASAKAFATLFPLLGIPHVRVPAQSRFLTSINGVSKFGINADVLTGRFTTIRALHDFINELNAPIDSIELWNEPNNPSEGNAYDPNFRVDLISFANQVREQFDKVPIWGPSILVDQNGFPSVAKELSKALSPLITAWNSHPYALDTPEGVGYGGFIPSSCGATMKEDCGWYGATNWNDNVSAVLAPALLGVASEGSASYGSYPALCGHTNVSLNAQQAYVQRGLLYGFKQGHMRTYPYKFLDDGGCSDGFGTYGIVSRITNADRSLSFYPKPAYTALAYFDRLLRDNGATASQFAPKGLAYALDGAGPDTEELLLALSDGSYRLILWSDAKLWDFNANGMHAAGNALAVTDRRVTVRLAKPANLTSYSQDEMNGVWATGESANDSLSIIVSVNQFPVIVDIDAAGPSNRRENLLRNIPSFPTPGPVETPSTPNSKRPQ